MKNVDPRIRKLLDAMMDEDQQPLHILVPLATAKREIKKLPYPELQLLLPGADGRVSISNPKRYRARQERMKLANKIAKQIGYDRHYPVK